MVEPRDLIFDGQIRRAIAILFLIIASSGLLSERVRAAGPAPIPVIELQSGDFLIEPAKGQARYFLDYSNELDADQMFARLGEFEPVTTQNLGFDAVQPGNPHVWFHFRVRSAADAPGEWVIDTGRPVGTIELSGYRSDGTGAAQLIFECNANTCPASSISPFIAGSLALSPGEQIDVLVRQEPRFSSQSPITFATPAAFSAWRTNGIAWQWVMNGAWIAIIAMALLMGRVIGWRLAIAYAAYATASFSLIGLAEGSLGLIPAGAFIPMAEDFGLQFGLIFLLVFCREFFQTWEYHPKSDRAMKLLILASAINLVPIIMGVGTTGRIIAQTLVVGALIAQVTVAIRAARVGWHGSIPVVLGALAIFSANVFDQANKLSGGSTNRYMSLDIIHSAFLAESIFFAVAIVLNVLSLQRERDLALREQLASTQESLRLSRDLETSRLRFDQARRDAEDSKREIAAIGHDLRQPLGALRSAIDKRPHKNEDEESTLNAALSLIEDIARRDETALSDGLPHQHGSPNSDEETFPIHVLLENTFRMFVDDANSKGIILKYVTSSQSVVCNPVALMRIASNLVSNAIAHSGANGIRIGCRSRGDCVSFEVHDDGRGMTQEELAAFMAEGARGDASTGSGIGLAIVTKLCAQHGWQFTARSEPGKGSSFAVRLPIAPPS